MRIRDLKEECRWEVYDTEEKMKRQADREREHEQMVERIQKRQGDNSKHILMLSMIRFVHQLHFLMGIAQDRIWSHHEGCLDSCTSFGQKGSFDCGNVLLYSILGRKKQDCYIAHAEDILSLWLSSLLMCRIIGMQWFETAIQDVPEDAHDLRRRVER